MSRRRAACQAPRMAGAEGLLIIVGTVAVGSVLVLLILKLTDRW
jgi:hypothetical protein